MNSKDAGFQMQDDKLAVPVDGFYQLILHAAAQHGELLANYVMRRKLCIHNAPAGELGREGADYRFHFG